MVCLMPISDVTFMAPVMSKLLLLLLGTDGIKTAYAYTREKMSVDVTEMSRRHQ